MLNQFEDMIINTLVQKLNTHGVQLDAATVKQAVANSPQIVKQVEEILMSNSQDRFEKIIVLVKQAAGNGAGSTLPNNAGNVNKS